MYGYDFPILPTTKVAALLNRYPELEDGTRKPLW
jgi:hypothetical protein